MLKGIGCDVVEISRIKSLLPKDGFLDKVYTAAEREFIAAKKAETAAGMWAAKEAVSKALGTGFCGFFMRDIEILHDQTGRPFAKLRGRARAIADDRGIKAIHISISHDRDNAMAFAVAE